MNMTRFRSRHRAAKTRKVRDSLGTLRIALALLVT